MPRFAANLTLLFTELPADQRISAAAKAGFAAAEILFPYTRPANAWADELERAALPLALINTPAPDWDAGGRGCAAVDGQQETFRAQFQTALDYCAALNVGLLHVMPGLAQGRKARDIFAENLAWASALAATSLPDLTLTLEPINPYDMPGYFLSDFDQALRLLNDLNRPNLALQFDAYHAQRITGDVLGTYARCAPRVAHIQIAAAEGRHEPVAGGAIDFAALFARLDADGYDGVISAEYCPKSGTEDGLCWLHAY